MRALIIVFMLIPMANSVAQNPFKEWYYPPQSKLFEPRHYFKTLQYYNNELESMHPVTAKDSADKANVYYLRGRCKFELTDKRGATMDLDLAIALNPKQESFWYYRGLAHHWLKHFDLALADYDKAIELNPRKMGYYLNRGFIKHLTGKSDAACYDFSKAGETGSFDIYEIIKEYCN